MFSRDSGGVEPLWNWAQECTQMILQWSFATTINHAIIYPIFDSSGIVFHMWAFFLQIFDASGI